MDNREKLTWRIWQSEGMGKALLIGGLLFYVPVLNLLLLGYLGRWARQLILRQGADLPEWHGGRALLEELGRVIVPVLVWVVLPFLLAGVLCWALGGLLIWLHLGFFARTVALLPLALVALLSPVALVSALVRLYKTDSLRQALDVNAILQGLARQIRRALFPLFQFYGIMALGWPLAGFAFFLAALPLLAQLVLAQRESDEDLKSPVF